MPVLMRKSLIKQLKILMIVVIFNWCFDNGGEKCLYSLILVILSRLKMKHL